MAKIGEIAGYKQLYLSEVDWRRPENRTKNPWKGKTIEKVGFTNDGDSNDKMFIILFTDKTFIAIEMEHDEDNSDEYHFADAFMYDIWGHEDAEAMYNCWVDGDGNVHLGEKIQMMVDLGLWNFTEEDAKRVRENYIKKQEEREWAHYLQLKEKFKEREAKENKQ